MDLLCFGDNLDRVACFEKKQLFDNLQKVYSRLGRRFQHVEIDVSTGTISWDKCGPWRQQPPGDESVAVTVALKAWATKSSSDKIIEITKQQLLGDEGPFSLINAFSLKQCALQSESSGETYVLYSLAPGLRKVLQPRPSDEEGATTLAMVKKSGTQVELEKRASKAKAQPVGVKTLQSSPRPAAKAQPATPKPESPPSKVKSKAASPSPAATAQLSPPKAAVQSPATAEEETPSPPEEAK